MGIKWIAYYMKVALVILDLAGGGGCIPEVSSIKTLPSVHVEGPALPLLYVQDC